MSGFQNVTIILTGCHCKSLEIVFFYLVIILQTAGFFIKSIPFKIQCKVVSILS